MEQRIEVPKDASPVGKLPAGWYAIKQRNVDHHQFVEIDFLGNDAEDEPRIDDKAVYWQDELDSKHDDMEDRGDSIVYYYYD